MSRKGSLGSWGLLMGVWLAVGTAHGATIRFDGATIRFDGLAHGEVVADQIDGVTISAINRVGGANLAVAFDTHAEDTADSDLEFPDRDLGNILIVQESADSCTPQGQPEQCGDPDDEGRRRGDGTPSSILVFGFDAAISQLGFVLVDVEDSVAEAGSVSFWSGGALQDSIGFEAFVVRDQAVYGNRSVNPIAPIDLLGFELAGAPIDEVRFALGGSGGIDDVQYLPAPEPGTAALLGVGLLGLSRAAGRTQGLRRSRSSK